MKKKKKDEIYGKAKNINKIEEYNKNLIQDCRDLNNKKQIYLDYVEIANQSK